MKITEHIYKTSGVEYGTNSNTFLLDCGSYLVFLDAGYKEVQWEAMMRVIREWKLADKPIRYALITHGHFDHAGNIRRLNELGTIVCAAEPDAGKIETGHPEMEQLFGTPWITGRVDERLTDGRVFSFGEGIRVTALAAPGHSEGSYAFLVEADGRRALCTGDMFYVGPKPPEDAVDIELAYMGGWDFSKEKFAETFLKMGSLHCDLLLPGHYYVWHGDVDALCKKAYEELMKEPDVTSCSA